MRQRFSHFIKTLPRNKNQNVGQITGLLDRYKNYIMTGDFVSFKNNLYCGPVFWNPAYNSFGIYTGCWYGDQNQYNPECYGKFIPIPRDNGMRMELEIIKEE